MKVNKKFQKTLLIFGFGYTARYLYQRLMQDNSCEWQIYVTTRDINSFSAPNMQVNVLEFNDNTVKQLLESQKITHILSCIAPQNNSDPVIHTYFEAIRSSNAKWIGYLSTTGVYGDVKGDWVDENSPLLTKQPRSLARIDAENQWLKFENTHIFRLAGIYGKPIHNLGKDMLRGLFDGTAKAIHKESQVFNRIHVEDIANSLYTSMLHPTPQEVFNLSDYLPAPSWQVLQFAAEKLNLPPPKIVEFEEEKHNMNAMAQSFYAENKRVSNKKLKSILKIDLKYPTFKEGILNIINDL